MLSSPACLYRGVPPSSILGPLLFSVYMNDLPLLLRETEVDIYADGTTIWLSGANCNEIQQSLNVSLSKANSSLKLNEMLPNSKKTKYLLIGTAKKLHYSEVTTLELSLDNVRLEDSVGEKRLGVLIDPRYRYNSYTERAMTFKFPDLSKIYLGTFWYNYHVHVINHVAMATTF